MMYETIKESISDDSFVSVRSAYVNGGLKIPQNGGLKFPTPKKAYPIGGEIPHVRHGGRIHDKPLSRLEKNNHY